MFLGQYTHSLDSKNRLTIPAKYRAELSSGAYIVQGYERNLIVYTTESYEKLAQQAQTHSNTNPEVRAMWRVVFGRAREVDLDSTGRILIPPFLKEYAGLENDATIVGTGECFEIWNSDTWSDELVSVTDSELNAERFTTFDLSTG